MLAKTFDEFKCKCIEDRSQYKVVYNNNGNERCLTEIETGK